MCSSDLCSFKLCPHREGRITAEAGGTFTVFSAPSPEFPVLPGPEAVVPCVPPWTAGGGSAGNCGVRDDAGGCVATGGKAFASVPDCAVAASVEKSGKMTSLSAPRSDKITVRADFFQLNPWCHFRADLKSAWRLAFDRYDRHALCRTVCVNDAA